MILLRYILGGKLLFDKANPAEVLKQNASSVIVLFELKSALLPVLLPKLFLFTSIVMDCPDGVKLKWLLNLVH